MSGIAEITRKLSEMADVPEERLGPATRVFADAGLAGADFERFMAWFAVKFGVDLSGVDLSRLAPDEYRTIFNLGAGAWRDVTIAQLAEAADAGNSLTPDRS